MKEIIQNLYDIDELGATVHAYLWRWDGGLTLIDTGLPGNAGTILDALANWGYRPADVVRIVITHADVDHTGSLAALKRATGAEVVCHTVEKELLEHPERRRPAQTLVGYLVRPLHWLLTTLLPRFRIQPLAPDRTLVDGDRLPEGFVVVYTPGHTPGHISLFHPERKLLITGDALTHFGGKLGTPPPLFTPDPENARRSIEKLAKKFGSEIETVVFGHGPPILAGGGAQIRTLADSLTAQD